VLTGKRLILCEGTSDEALLRALIDTRNLPEFCIRNGSDLPGDNSGGISMIGRLLAGIIIWEGFSSISDILIVVDSDSDPNSNFREVRSQIQSVTDYAYPIPDQLLVRGAGSPTMAVLTLPWIDEPGNLETLCLPFAMKGNCKAVDGLGSRLYLPRRGRNRQAVYSRRPRCAALSCGISYVAGR
jgi:hypothetical protein